MKVKLKKLRNDVVVPVYSTPYAAGCDVLAHTFERAYTKEEPNGVSVDAGEKFRLDPGDRILIFAGFSVEIPEGYELQIRPRSGLALKQGLTVLNTPGTIDADYRGEVGVIVVNHDRKSHWIEKGDRICQMVLARVAQAEWEISSDLSNSERGEGGFGSTGKK